MLVPCMLIIFIYFIYFIFLTSLFLYLMGKKVRGKGKNLYMRDENAGNNVLLMAN